VKARRLAAARKALAMPAGNPVAHEQAAEFMRRVAAQDTERCCFCAGGRQLVRAKIGRTPMPRSAGAGLRHLHGGRGPAEPDQ
jgi:hypothetical protein